MIEQGTTLSRALEALNSVCRIPPETDTRQIAQDLRSSPRTHEEVRLSCRIPAQDPEAWRAPFVEWLKSQCVYHSRGFGGLVCLHRDYCEWEIARNDVPCTRETFTTLLSEAGFLMGEIRGTVLVSGLISKSDAAAHFPANNGETAGGVL